MTIYGSISFYIEITFMVCHFYGQITFMAEWLLWPRYGPENYSLTWAKFSDIEVYVNLAIGLLHLHKCWIWPPDNISCINLKLGHPKAPFVLVSNLVTGESPALRRCPWLLCWHFPLVLSWYLHQPELHQLSLKKEAQSIPDTPTHRSDPQVFLGPILRLPPWQRRPNHYIIIL